MPITRQSRKRSRRRGHAVVLTAVSATMLISFAALSVDVGLLYHTKTELQRTADAAALAGAWSLILDEERLNGNAGAALAVDNSRLPVANVVNRNKVLNNGLGIDMNSGNAPDGDIVFGMLSNPSDHTEVMTPCTDSTTNSCSVVTRRDTTRNGQVPLLFAGIFGKSGSDVSTRATACFEYGMIGFKVTPGTGNADLMPITLQVDAWQALKDGLLTCGDNYAYDPDTGTVSPGSDGILELNIYPGAGAEFLPPGNFGTVDIGDPNNSESDLERQLIEGVNEIDLAFFGGELTIGDDGSIIMEGDTGLSAGIKDELAAIVGQARTIPLFDTALLNGNNSQFDIVRFGGVRIMHVHLTGPMAGKQLIIQPAIVVDDAVIPTNDMGDNDGDYVYAPPKLYR